MKIKNTKKTRRKKINPTVYMALVLALLVVMNVFLSIKVSIIGTDLLGVEKQMSSIAKENRYLREKIVAHTSITQLSTLSESFDLVKPLNILYLSGEDPVAYLPGRAANE